MKNLTTERKAYAFDLLNVINPDKATKALKIAKRIISKRTLRMMDRSMANFRKGKVGAAVLILIVTSIASCTTTSKLANDAVTTVAKHYGGNKAGELASAGLYAAADVLQGYVDKKPPLDVIQQSPGVKGVGQLLVGYLQDKGIVKQETINKIHAAAQVAANVTVQQRSTVNDGP